MKVLFIFGTRPEAIKLAPLIQELGRRPQFTARLCVTAQHRQLLDQVLDAFSLKSDHDLNLMRPGQDLFDLTARCLPALRDVLQAEKPGWVIVQGDTTTTLAAALASFYAGVRIAHVEAGLRTGDKHRPFPEEINRRLVTHLADLHFAPTEQARRDLLLEGVPEQRIHVTGNTVVDALVYMRERVRRSWPVDPSRKIILVTGHRREGFGHGFERICRALQRIAKRKDVEIVYPVHLNPEVQEPVRGMLGGLANVKLIEPLPYAAFVGLMEASYLILTDSGGVQEEGPSLGKPVLVMREVTERREAIEAGGARLVGTDEDRIAWAVEELLDDPETSRRMALSHNPYGDGRASVRIADALAAFS